MSVNNNKKKKNLYHFHLNHRSYEDLDNKYIFQNRDTKMDKFMIIFINFSKNKKKNKIQFGLSHKLNNNKE